MDYVKIYNSLIKSRLLKNSTKNNDGLLEKHHIIPKCLGGSNSKTNLVLLSPREHYIAHWLLYKMYTDKIKAKMAYAFFCMCRKNSNQKRSITSKMYERSRQAMSDTCYGENHHNFGKVVWDEKARKNISSRMRGEGNHRYGKEPWNAGLTKDNSEKILAATNKMKETRRLNPQIYTPRTEEFKKKASEWMTGVPKTEECKRKLSEANKGKKLTQATKDKISAIKKANPEEIIQYTCIHCGFTGKGAAMFRWHFNNCRLKE